MNNSSPHRGWYLSRRLPHLDDPYVTQTITFRLYDSLPQVVVQQLAIELRLNPKLTIEQRKRIEGYLDKGYGACYLCIPTVAELVVSAFEFYHEKRYELVAWVVMPNHVHVIIHTWHGFPLQDIIRDWKGYTAQVANRHLTRKGAFWQTGYFDRFIRNDRHFSNAIDYVHNNPVLAGLVATPGAWKFSSAPVGVSLNQRWGDRRAGILALLHCPLYKCDKEHKFVSS